MSIEIEAKFRVREFSSLRRKLRSEGARYLCTVLITDTYYDTSERALLGRDCGLRIRRLRCLRRGRDAVDTRAVLTAKGPGRGGLAAKIRAELETPLAEPDGVAEMLLAFGLTDTLTIEKRRASYRLDNCAIELDELPLIGCFVEVEAPREEDIDPMRRRLHLPDEPITDHYVNMLLAAAQRAGQVRSNFTLRR